MTRWQRRTETSRHAHKDRTRGGRVVGLGIASGMVLALGVIRLAAPPIAYADILDSILDPAIGSVQMATTGLPADSLAGLDPIAGWPGSDVGGLVDLASPGSSGSDLASTGGFDAAAAASAAISLPEPVAALLSSWGRQVTAWFDQYIYLPLHTDMENWIDSPLGQQADDFINSVSGQYLIGNGASGTAAHPDGGNAGLLFGDGGNGYGYTGNGQTLLYSHVTTATDGPLVTTADFTNTGYAPFELGPMYIRESPSGFGTTTFDY